MASAATFLMAQFLDWVDRKPRPVIEVRAAWGSTCPLNCVWEDALAETLVEHRPDRTLALTAQGRQRLEQRP